MLNILKKKSNNRKEVAVSEWDNKFINEIRASRYIASWTKAYGPYYDENFEKWLKNLGVNEEDIFNLVQMATCGKFELERNAREFIANIGA